MSRNEERDRLIPLTPKNSNQMTGRCTLSWSQIRVETPTPSAPFWKWKKQPQKSRSILNGLTGIVRPNEVLAIMGTSGVGKTTLMNVLSGNSNENSVSTTGNVYLNGTVTSDSQRQKGGTIGYVEQQEVFIDTLTVQEHLTFQAMLGIRQELTDTERRLRMKNIVSQFHLTKCAGRTIQKLSGGEKKRLTLASVFLLEPQVLLIDEPTSGLDAYLAMDIMRTIGSMAVDRHKTIIVVIHQPTSAMFDLVDNICLLVRGGRQAFFGSKNDALEFFSTQCKLSASSLDGFIEQLAAPSKKKDDQNIEIQEDTADRYINSEHATSLDTTVRNDIESSVKVDEKNRSTIVKRSTFARRMKWLLWRSFLADVKNPVRTIYILIRTLIPTLFFSLLYLRLCATQHFVQNVNALNVAVISLIINTSTHMILGTMPLNNNIGIRENRRGMYGVLAYYLSVVIHDFPTFIIFPFTVNTIIYWMSGMDNTASHYFMFIGLGILASLAGAAFGQLFSSFYNSIEGAMATAVPMLQVLSIFSGFYLNFIRTSNALQAIQYISPYYYYYSSLLSVQWNSKSLNHTIKCTHSQQSIVNNTQISSNILSSIVTLCNRILQHVNLWQLLGNVWFNVLMLVVLVSICHIIAFIVIWCRANRREIAEYWSKMRKKKSKTHQAL